MPEPTNPNPIGPQRAAAPDAAPTAPLGQPAVPPTTQSVTLGQLQAQQPVAVQQAIKPRPPGLPRYKVLQVSYINGALAQPGDIVDYAHEPGYNLEHVAGTPVWTPNGIVPWGDQPAPAPGTF